MLDDQSVITEREVDNLALAISLIGGFLGLLQAFCSQITSWI